MKVFNNIYVKDYKKFPYTKLKGKSILHYKGAIKFYVGGVPEKYNSKEDLIIDCDCEFENWSQLKKIF
jgi:hypothetical protein